MRGLRLRGRVGRERCAMSGAEDRGPGADAAPAEPPGAVLSVDVAGLLAQLARSFALLLPVYALGYLGLSFSWVLLALGLLVWCRRSRGLKATRLCRALALLEDEERAVRLGVRACDLPAWVSAGSPPGPGADQDPAPTPPGPVVRPAVSFRGHRAGCPERRRALRALTCQVSPRLGPRPSPCPGPQTPPHPPREGRLPCPRRRPARSRTGEGRAARWGLGSAARAGAFPLGALAVTRASGMCSGRRRGGGGLCSQRHSRPVPPALPRPGDRRRSLVFLGRGSGRAFPLTAGGGRSGSCLLRGLCRLCVVSGTTEQGGSPGGLMATFV